MDTQTLEQRLSLWADWLTRGVGAGLGYPPKNWIVTLTENGGHSQKRGHPPILGSHRQAEEIEAWVMILAQEYRCLADSLREYYCGEGMMSQKAKRLNLSYRQFKHCVDKAKMWLAGRLSHKQHH